MAILLKKTVDEIQKRHNYCAPWGLCTDYLRHGGLGQCNCEGNALHKFLLIFREHQNPEQPTWLHFWGLNNHDTLCCPFETIAGIAKKVKKNGARVISRTSIKMKET